MARCYANKIFLLLSKLDSIIRHDFFSFFLSFALMKSFKGKNLVLCYTYLVFPS